MITFHLPELILESVIRDGFQNVRNDPTIIDSLFSQLTRTYAATKYGQTEINKIQALCNKDIAVVYSYNEVDAKSPCISIMVGTDDEARARDHLSDDYGTTDAEIVDPAVLAGLHRVDNLSITSYNPLTGQVIVVDATDMSPVYKGMIYVDSIGTEHDIIGPISNDLGNKFFFVNKLDEVDFHDTTGYIKSSLNFERREVRGLTSDVKLVCGVHSKDALTTKYLYILLKYFIVSRKYDIIKRGLYLPMYSGSDFGRDSQYVGDQMFTRFCTFTGKVDDTWMSDQVILIDNIVVVPEPID